MPGIPDSPLGPQSSCSRRILGVGIATLDLINEVDRYPDEDSEIRVLAQRRTRGGNVTNTLAVLSQLGHRCSWCGTLADDAASHEILADLARHGIDTEGAVRVARATTPTSYITLSRATGSRSIVHYRDLPELASADFGGFSLAGIEWAHFEGRMPAETQVMMRRVRHECPDASISVELEKMRPGIDALLDGPHVILAGRAFAQVQGVSDPAEFLLDLLGRTSAGVCVLGWGAAGAWYMIRGDRPRQVPGWSPAQVLDTLGAGDCLNAGVIDGLARGVSPDAAVARAVRLAGFKCGRIGLDGLVTETVAAGHL